MHLKPQYVFSTLCLLFASFSISLYLQPMNSPSDSSSTRAGEGKLVWQKYNCQSCHQLYGLGGYLGPDLTNIISEKGKGETWIRAIVKSGNSQMPSFTLTNQEESDLIQFLNAADKSGIADPRSFKANSFGMIE